MRKLEEITAAEEHRIEKAEKDLEEDAVRLRRPSANDRQLPPVFFSICSINSWQRTIRTPTKRLVCKRSAPVEACVIALI